MPTTARRRSSPAPLLVVLLSLAVSGPAYGQAQAAAQASASPAPRVRLVATGGTISNRTEMHAAVRNATELLQQEVGQAGRITLPYDITLAGTVDSTTFTASSTMGLYAGE